MRKKSLDKKQKYRGIVVGKGLLIGGVRRHASSWFDTKKEADDWAWAISAGNEQSGRPVEFVTIERRRGGVTDRRSVRFG
jgi:hypothetical protein